MPICDDATSPAETHRLRAPPAAARSEARTDRVGGGSARRPQAEHASWGGHPCYAAGRQVAQVNRVEHAGVFDPDEVLYLHDDHLGSTSVVRGTDTNGLPVTETRDFTSFGEVVTPSSPTPSPDWTGTGIMAGFTGHQHDAELGLVNMRGRMYDPRLGRFITADPFATEPLNPQGLNRYAYVQNNPVNFTDPSGFECQVIEYVTVQTPNGEQTVKVTHSCGGEGGGSSGSNQNTGGQSSSQSSDPRTPGGSYSDAAAQQAAANQAAMQAGMYAQGPIGGWNCPTCYNPQTAPRGPSPNGNPSELGTGTPSGSTNAERLGSAENERLRLQEALERVRWQKTPEMAGYLALWRMNPPSIKYGVELYSFIVEQNGQYGALPPEAGGPHESTGMPQRYLDLKDALPDGARIVESIHTHGRGGGPYSEHFGPADRQFSAQFGLTGQLGTPESRWLMLLPPTSVRDVGNAAAWVETPMGSLPP